MEFRNLGDSGLRVSEIGLGCNNFGAKLDEQQTQVVVNAAIDAGITLFDTADVYGYTRSESFLGKALAKCRHDVVIATKFGLSAWDGEHRKGASRRWIMQAVEDSLTRLQTDYIDLYQLHMPDLATPVEETLRALDDLIRQGKVRYIGCSNFSGWQIADANWIARELVINRFISVQNEFSMLNRGVEREVLPTCEHFQLGLLPFFPLASGLLTGKYVRGAPPPEGSRLSGRRGAKSLTDDNFDLVERLSTFARDRNRTMLDLAFAWLLAHRPVASVIAGATSADQVGGNAKAAGWRLSAEDMSEIHAIFTAESGAGA
ncbi:aldo/keto reductase [Sphingobium sp. Sx8-8]|uniref:aldo/keto reductase n=1 Tax=Sphingobium sp. Sx8-8 TaxID=2933617 RepID=UPI001F57B6B8|nr:aldo/keto reductase [Sphingobium sp. Sx8-8]